MTNLTQLKGYLLFVPVFIGSKSEHLGPVLFQSKDETVLLFREGDNPFMHESLRPYHHQYCVVKGAFDNQEKYFLVESIIAIDDPVNFGNVEN